MNNKEYNDSVQAKLTGTALDQSHMLRFLFVCVLIFTVTPSELDYGLRSTTGSQY